MPIDYRDGAKGLSPNTSYDVLRYNQLEGIVLVLRHYPDQQSYVQDTREIMEALKTRLFASQDKDRLVYTPINSD